MCCQSSPCYLRSFSICSNYIHFGPSSLGPPSFRSLFKDRNEQRTEVPEDQWRKDQWLRHFGPWYWSVHQRTDLHVTQQRLHNGASVHLYVSLLTSHASWAPAGYVLRRQSQSLSGGVHVMQQVEKIVENTKFLFCRRPLQPWIQRETLALLRTVISQCWHM